MHPSLKHPHDTYTHQANTLLDDLRTLTPTQRNHRPDPETWSLTMVVHHLALVDTGVAKSLAEGLPEHKRKPRLMQRLMGPLVKLVLRSPLRVKIPTERVAPDPDLDFPEVEDRWLAARAELREHLEQIDDDRIDEPAFIHPISGPLPPARVLAFLNDHLDHHMRQVRRIRNDADFPAG